MTRNSNPFRQGCVMAAERSRPWLLLALLMALTAASTVNAFTSVPTDSNNSQNNKTVPFGAGPCAASAGVRPVTALASLDPDPSMTFPNASYGTGGAALRNREAGNIGVSGVNGATQAAIIYWAVITDGPPPVADTSINVQRLSPGPPSVVVNVTGTVVGTGPQPCWIGDTITVFRAAIPLVVATGNGSYQVTINPGAGGVTDGSDPWVSFPVLPLFEGASIVLVGAGTGTVAIYDVGLAGNTFFGNPGLTYMLSLPTTASGTLTLFDNIGADGQQGLSRTSLIADEGTTINGIPVAGPGSLYNDSDWNGSSGYPLPQLWDDTGHDITGATPAGTTLLTINVSTTNPLFDCLTPVANVIEIH